MRIGAARRIPKVNRVGVAFFISLVSAKALCASFEDRANIQLHYNNIAKAVRSNIANISIAQDKDCQNAYGNGNKRDKDKQFSCGEYHLGRTLIPLSYDPQKYENNTVAFQNKLKKLKIFYNGREGWDYNLLENSKHSYNDQFATNSLHIPTLVRRKLNTHTINLNSLSDNKMMPFEIERKAITGKNSVVSLNISQDGGLETTFCQYFPGFQLLIPPLRDVPYKYKSIANIEIPKKQVESCTNLPILGKTCAYSFEIPTGVNIQEGAGTAILDLFFPKVEFSGARFCTRLIVGRTWSSAGYPEVVAKNVAANVYGSKLKGIAHIDATKGKSFVNTILNVVAPIAHLFSAFETYAINSVLDKTVFEKEISETYLKDINSKISNGIKDALDDLMAKYNFQNGDGNEVIINVLSELKKSSTNHTEIKAYTHLIKRIQSGGLKMNYTLNVSKAPESSHDCLGKDLFVRDYHSFENKEWWSKYYTNIGGKKFRGGCKLNIFDIKITSDLSQEEATAMACLFNVVNEALSVNGHVASVSAAKCAGDVASYASSTIKAMSSKMGRYVSRYSSRSRGRAAAYRRSYSKRSNYYRNRNRNRNRNYQRSSRR